MVLLNLQALEERTKQSEKISKIKESIEKTNIKNQLLPKKVKPMALMRNARSRNSGSKISDALEKFNVQKIIKQAKEEEEILKFNSKELSHNLITVVNQAITMPHKNQEKFKKYVEESETMQNILKREIENYGIDHLSDRNIFALLYASYYSKALF
jgi:hypothetical protein